MNRLDFIKSRVDHASKHVASITADIYIQDILYLIGKLNQAENYLYDISTSEFPTYIDTTVRDSYENYAKWSLKKLNE